MFGHVPLYLAILVAATPFAYAQGPCLLTVPPEALTAKGLATPYELSGGCKQSDPKTQTFVEATIFDPATGELFAYSPLVVTKGTQPLAVPVVPRLPANAVVGLWFGTNADNLQLVDQNGSLNQAKCVNGEGKSIFGQFASCNGEAFFAATEKAALNIPALGTDKNGDPCPTTRDFAVIDQDQSDNVITQYIVVGEQTAQDTAENRAKFTNAQKAKNNKKRGTVITNGSDNALLFDFLDPALGCTPFKINALDGGASDARATLASNELHANKFQKDPVALVPATDPMVLVNNKEDLTKLNLYRVNVGQPKAKNLGEASGKTYCENFGKIAPAVIFKQKDLTIKGKTPAADTGNNLFTFLGARFSASWTNLGCDKLLKQKSPITPIVNKQGVATDLKFALGNNVTAAVNVKLQATTTAKGFRSRTKATLASATTTVDVTKNRKNENKNKNLVSVTSMATPAAATTDAQISNKKTKNANGNGNTNNQNAIQKVIELLQQAITALQSA
ncbi:hypothetical protein HK102_002419 [Quaeritorhiza haematococci]|nr:hypothetical protein HK102_002419 [Quaeritorhiza haematococci]